MKNVTIKTRLIFVIAFLAVQLVVGGVIGIASLSRANESMRTIYDDRLVALNMLDQIVRTLNFGEMQFSRALTGDPAAVPRVMDQIEAGAAAGTKVWAQYMATYLTSDEAQLAHQFADAREKYLNEALLPAIKTLRAGDTAAAGALLHGPMTTLFQPLEENMNALIKLQLTVAKQEFDQAQRTYQLVRISCSAALVLGLILAAVIGTWLVQAITRPLNKAVRVAAAVAAGDLTQEIRVESADETGRLLQALKNMNDSLTSIVREVRAGSDVIATGSSQIAAGNLDLSSRTEQQASSLEETASSMEELTSTVKQNADNARQANQLATTASEVAAKGGTVVSEVVDTMGAIDASAKKIVDIISVIDGIAFQTNILALNAAVEAARAGEQGRGFAVVATEVRNLAQRSASAAKEIKVLIGDSTEKVTQGTRLVGEAGKTMQEVVDSIRRVTDIMGEITAASQEQTAGIEQINQAIAQMDEVTQQNASLVEEAAAASTSMQEQSARLAQAVGVFKLGAGHDAHHGRRESAPATIAAAAPPRPASPRGVARLGGARPVPQKGPANGEEWEEF